MSLLIRPFWRSHDSFQVPFSSPFHPHFIPISSPSQNKPHPTILKSGKMLIFRDSVRETRSNFLQRLDPPLDIEKGHFDTTPPVLPSNLCLGTLNLVRFQVQLKPTTSSRPRSRIVSLPLRTRVNQPPLSPVSHVRKGTKP